MASKDKFVVRLTADQRARLEQMIAAGRHAAAALVHACVLLKADAGAGGPGWADDPIAEALECAAATVARVRKRFVQGGFDAAVHRKKPTGRQYRKLDGQQEARLVALACSTPPGGKARWTLKMLADRPVELAWRRSRPRCEPASASTAVSRAWGHGGGRSRPGRGSGTRPP